MSTIARHTLYNLAGSGIPLLLFVVTIPIYIALIGAERYGVLAIVWLVLGFFGLMDMGLGRAVTQKIASLSGTRSCEHRAVLGTAIVINLVIGLIGAGLMYGAAGLVFSEVVSLDPDLRKEAFSVVPLMAIGVPVVTIYAILLGALQGIEKFGPTNRIAIVNAVIFQCLPLAVAWLCSVDLFPLVGAALAARLVAVGMLWRECCKAFGAGLIGGFERGQIAPLLSFGGWVALTALLGMVLVFSDRLIIGSLLGAVAVTIYAVPLDVSRRLNVVSEALSNALFPRLSFADAKRSRELVSVANSVLFVVSTPIVAGLIVAAEPLLRLWLGEAIGSQSAPLFQILVIAAWTNIFARQPYAKLQAEGRPKTVAVIAMIQVPVFLAALFVALDRFGLMGAAVVYLVRNSIDYLMLAYAAGMIADRLAIRVTGYLSLVGLAVGMQSVAAPSLVLALLLGAAAGAAVLLAAWFTLPAEVKETAGAMVANGLGARR